MKYFRFFPKLDYDLDDNGQTKQVVDLFRFSKIITGIEDNITFYRNYYIQDGERPDHVSYKLYQTVDYYWTFFVANPELKSIYEDWPRSQEELEHMLNDKYPNYVLNISSYDFFDKFEIGETIQGLVSGATATILAKNVNLGWIKISTPTKTFQANEIVRGLISGDFETIDGQAPERNAAHHYEQGDYVVERSTPNAAIVTFAEYERNANDDKRAIKVIRPEFISDVATQFRESINV